MNHRAPPGSARLHPTRYLLYSFVLGAVITCIGFVLAQLQAPRDSLRKPATTLVVAGSETLRPLVTACAKSYVSKNPGVEVVVRGGGTANGVASLLAGQIDLALSSRELNSAELNADLPSGEPRAIPIAREGIAVIVHQDVRTRALDLEQLAGVLAGEITDWSAFGADRGAVVVFGRSAGSGTADVVQERVLGRLAIADGAHLKESHEEVIQSVGMTKGALGYADAHLARTHGSRVRLIPLRHGADGEAYPPEPTAIRSGKYPLARTLYLVAIEPMADPVRSLVDHCTGAPTHSLIQNAGFLPAEPPRSAISPERRSATGSR